LLKITVISFHGWEHCQLLDVWSFFPFTADVSWTYLHPEVDCAGYYPDNPSFGHITFPGSRQEAAVAICQFVKDSVTAPVFFASLKTASDFWSILGENAAIVFYSKKSALADLHAVMDDQDKFISLVTSQLGKDPAILSRETASFENYGIKNTYPDLESYFLDAVNEVLLTHNSDLTSWVYATDPYGCRLCYIHPQYRAWNLMITEHRVDFLRLISNLDNIAKDIREDGAFDRQIGLQNKNRSSAAMHSYSFFAEYYDEYMQHVCYDEWLDLMLSWYRKYNPEKIRRVLELACGTANAAEILVYRGYEVDACDGSPQMLNIANKKPLKPNLFLSDMTAPLPQKDYDLIFCLFDSINYLLESKQISLLLDNVHTALKPGGIFIFDISTLLNSLENFNGITNFTRFKDGYLIHNANYEVLSNKQFSHFTLFRKSGENYQKLEERHVQRVYRTPELIELIRESPLDLQAVFAPEWKSNLLTKTNPDPDKRYFRLFFLLQKSK
jgi:SAM-dependent methyltransferase